MGVSHGHRRIILETTEFGRGLFEIYVYTYEFTDGLMNFRWKGISLPYPAFDKFQRATHAVIN